MKNLISIILLTLFSIVAPALADPNWTGIEIEGFENGWHGWTVDVNGVWQIGEPNYGSIEPHDGNSVAATNLDGDYPPQTDSRLISPGIVLPTVSGDERLELRFWQWYSYNYAWGGPIEEGQVQISVWDGNDWGGWDDVLAIPAKANWNSPWSRVSVDLTLYSGQEVRLAFYHQAYHSGGADGEGPGWYIDDVEIWKGVPTFVNPETFELGWGDWSTDNGVWQIGVPSSGGTHSGSNVAATVLDGYYPPQTDSRLISPGLVLPAVSGDERVELRFWQWYSYNYSYQGPPEEGQVQISVKDGNDWGGWDVLAIPAKASTNSPWSRVSVDLTFYSGQEVQLAFYHQAYRAGGHTDLEDAGWYIDDVEIWQGVPIFVNPETFELGWDDWSTDNGVWQIGAPSSGGTHSGSNVAATVLDGYYPPQTDSRLISPGLVLPVVSGDERLELRFWQWYSYNYSYLGPPEEGQVQISVKDGNDWGGWDVLAIPAKANWNSPWSRVSVDLTFYSGQEVQLAFYHQAYRAGGHTDLEDAGWYIDDVEIWQGVPTFVNPETFELGWGDWSTDNGVWQIGQPQYGPGPASTPSGTNCVGTNLNGEYPYRTDSNLVSPVMDLPSVGEHEHLELRFSHWFNYSATTVNGWEKPAKDYGSVDIQKYVDGSWSEWQTVADYIAFQNSGLWSEASIDLELFAGERVRLRFTHWDITEGSGDWHDEDIGWYIDDVSISIQPVVSGEFTEDFESGWGGWSASRGVWELGQPQYGPGPASTPSGSNCVGTNLTGEYPYRTDSQLVSPVMDLPSVEEHEHLELRFSHWFNYSATTVNGWEKPAKDYGSVDIQKYVTGSWSEWQTVADYIAFQNSGLWSEASVDLKLFAGERVRLRFAHWDITEEVKSGPDWHDEDIGWYIDDVSISIQPVVSGEFTEDFESGWGGWSASRGVWELGQPSSGPSSGYESIKCAATVLAGNYPYQTDSYLVTPVLNLPSVGAKDQLLLRYRNWYKFASSDSGVIEISVWRNDGWESWKTIGQSISGSSNGEWLSEYVVLSPFAGQKIRLGFLHSDVTEVVVSGPDQHYEDLGWYIDKVELSHFVPETLTLGQDVNSAFSGDYDRKYYLLEAPSGGHLRITFNDWDDSGKNELYIRYGVLPSTGSYDYRYSTQGGADQQIFVLDARPGPWYILAYGESVPPTGEYTIRADFFTGIVLQNLSPDSHGNAVAADITIDGAGFIPTDEVVLAQGATTYDANEVIFVSKQRLIANFDLPSVPDGNYVLRVSSATSSDELPFEVVDGGEAKLWTNLIIPSRLGYHNLGTIYVEYANIGEVSMPAPLLVLRATQLGREGAILTLDKSKLTRGFWASAMPEGFNTSIQILASEDTPGMLQPGEYKKVPIYWAGWLKPWDTSNYPPFDFNLGVLTQGSNEPVDWASMKDEMRPYTIPHETVAWNALWDNFTTQAGSTWGDYLEMLTENAVYLGQIGRNVIDISELLAFEFAQADGLNIIQTLSSATDAYVPAPGLDISIRRVYSQNISSRCDYARFGWGWSYNWEWRLIDVHGTVQMRTPEGGERIYQEDIRSGRPYISMVGDHAILRKIPGGYSYTEANGLLRVFSSVGRLDYIEDTKGNRLTCTYSSKGSLTRIEHSSGQYLDLNVNPSYFMLESVVDPNGRQTTYTYNEINRYLASVTYFDGKTISYTYDTETNPSTIHPLKSITYPGDHQLYFDYDARGRLISIQRDGAAERLDFSYDNTGKINVTNAYNDTSQFYMDHFGLLAKVENPLGNSVHLDYDFEYNLTEITDPNGGSYLYSYDDSGNLIHITNPLGDSTRFWYYGPYNRMTKLVDAKGNVTDYAYDDWANLLSIIYDDGSMEAWTYDIYGEPNTWTNRRDDTIDYEYDTDGRITAKIYPDASQVDYTYDGRGNLVNATDETGTTILDYDANDRLQRITDPCGRYLEFTYDSAGRRKSSVDQLGHTLNYYYDDISGRLEYITDVNNLEIVRYHYDDVGRLSQKDLGNGVYTTYQYDPVGQLLNLTNYKPDHSILSKFDYTYDARGRRTSMTVGYGGSDPRNSGMWQYEYDDLGQLTAWTDPNGRHVEYIYDALGNRIDVNDNGVVTHYVTNGLNQYTQVGDTTYQYDLDGNLQQKTASEGTTNYTFDYENRLTAVSSPTGNWQYTYDAFGNRVAATDNGTTTNYVIDPIGFGDVVGEYTDGNLIAHYDHGFGLLSRTDSNGLGFYTFEAIGSTSEISEPTGIALNRYLHLPFGEKQYKSETKSNPFEFVGEYGVMREGNGLDSMRARFYDPSVGRFISTDPIGLAGRDLNLYRYVYNKPVLLIDPLGLISDEEIRSSNIDPDAPGPGPMWPTQRDYYQWIEELHEKRWWQWPADLPGLGSSGTPPFIEPPGTVKDPNPFDKLPKWWPFKWPFAKPDPKGHTDDGGSGSSGNAGSKDPNRKRGRKGFGLAGYVAAADLMPYQVDFENDPNATAPAQIVTISDLLDADLDCNSFELTEIGFGDHILEVPEGSQHYEGKVMMDQNEVEFEVQIEAGIHLTTGEVYANFYSVDPYTGLPPAVEYGFLPPEDGNGVGQGYIGYVIRSYSDLPTGTEIRNIAYITFDFAETIATNQIDPHDPGQGTDPNLECLNTIDSGEPQSHVLSLPAGSTTPFNVVWDGTDDGSGIAYYEIYVSENSEPYELWLTADNNSAGYFGDLGSTYEFYSVAVDNVGNRESIPAVADATTTVDKIHEPDPDINHDGFVNWLDVRLLVYYWLHDDCAITGNWCEDADIIRTGTVDFIDYAGLTAAWDGNGYISPYPTLYDIIGGSAPAIEESQKDRATLINPGQDCVATVLVENGGYANQNAIGLYDPNDPNEKLELFVGSDSPYDTVTIRFNTIAGTVENLNTGQKANIGETFGFYIVSPDNGGVTFYTDDILNPSQDNYGLIYDTYGYTSVITGDPDVVIAFEDVVGLGDEDYDDMVIGITNTEPSNP